MKIGVAIICLLLAGILGLEIDARQDRIKAGERKREEQPTAIAPRLSASESKSTVPAAKTEARSPILAQASLFHYGGDEGSMGFEGKIYNPNAFPLTSVNVTWQVYPTLDAKNASVFRRYKFEDTCDFYFAYIPPFTTYDFKTSKIKERAFSIVDSLGLDASFSKMAADLTPKIDFKAER